jgi:hypothetical protein
MENAGIANLPIICKALTLCLSPSQQEERRFDSPKRLCYDTLSFMDGIPPFVSMDKIRSDRHDAWSPTYP